MELVFQLIMFLISMLFILVILGIFISKAEQKEEWLKEFKGGYTVLSTKYGEGIIICVKPSIYKAYIKFESFSGWISLDDLVPVGKHRNKYY